MIIYKNIFLFFLVYLSQWWFYTKLFQKLPTGFVMFKFMYTDAALIFDFFYIETVCI